jgi:hypothetical protein
VDLPSQVTGGGAGGGEMEPIQTTSKEYFHNSLEDCFSPVQVLICMEKIGGNNVI